MARSPQDLGVSRSVQHGARPGGNAPSNAPSPTEEREPDLSALIADGEGKSKGKDPQGVIDEIHTAAEIEAEVSGDRAFGRVGQRFDHRSPFYIGMTGAQAWLSCSWSARSSSPSASSCC